MQLRRTLEILRNNWNFSAVTTTMCFNRSRTSRIFTNLKIFFNGNKLSWIVKVNLKHVFRMERIRPQTYFRKIRKLKKHFHSIQCFCEKKLNWVIYKIVLPKIFRGQVYSQQNALRCTTMLDPVQNDVKRLIFVALQQVSIVVWFFQIVSHRNPSRFGPIGFIKPASCHDIIVRCKCWLVSDFEQ